MNKMLNKRYIIVLCLCLFSGILNAQMLQDTSSMNLVKKGINHIYNTQFAEAENILAILNTRYPGHPATYMFKGLVIYYQNYPLIPANPLSKIFEMQLKTCIRICEEKDGWIDNPEYVLLNVCARGLLMLFYSENDLSNEVMPMAASTYRCVRKSFEFTSVYADFSYFTGLYNYYREAYPEHHPVYKAVAFLFPRGDKEKGLIELQYAAENAIVLKAESYSILSWISIQYENNYPDALKYSKTLSEKFPTNPMFKGEYVKNLLLLKEYDGAEEMIISSAEEKNSYFQAQMAIFKGLLQEKKYKNYLLARQYYEEGARDMEPFGARGEDYAKYGEKSIKRVKDLQEGKRSDKRQKNKDQEDSDPDAFDFND